MQAQPAISFCEFFAFSFCKEKAKKTPKSIGAFFYLRGIKNEFAGLNGCFDLTMQGIF
ncbi:MAG: hypothetical protein IJ489_08155 [Clostridia bacterium]|nr:hypothetical protein [Clostridia bacterium]